MAALSRSGLSMSAYCALLAGCAVAPTSAWSAENGTTSFPNGGEDFLVAAMPPPGWYGTLYLTRYTADEVVDDSGRMAVADFDLTVNAITPRLDWVKPVSIFGADRWGTLLILPLLDLDLQIEPVPGVNLRGSEQGIGDLTIGNGLHWTLGKFEVVNALDLVVPIGSYDSSRLVNPGRNQWVARLSHMGTWFPSPSWDLSYRLHWDYNFRNDDTDYKSGQTVYLNWAAGWKPSPATTIGAVGYLLRQVTDDRIGSQAVQPDGNRLRVSGIGAAVKHAAPHGVMYTIKYFREFDARNGPEGDQLWLNAALRF
jgi:hypothetical protein